MPQEVYDRGVTATIAERGWETFTVQPEAVVVAIVEEFYANGKEARNNVVQVRGKSVAFNNVSINAYYQTVPMDHDEYTAYKQEELDWDQVINGDLCRPEAEWTLKGDEAVHFSHSELNRFGKAWYYFICANMMSSTHMTEVIKDREMLLYALVIGKRIDAGKVLYSSICHTLRRSSTCGLSHPSLICGICKNARVVWEDDEIFQQPKTLIDNKIISQ